MFLGLVLKIEFFPDMSYFIYSVSPKYILCVVTCIIMMIGQMGEGAIAKSGLNHGRRAKQLEAVFYKHATSIISTGELDPQLTELAVTLTKVSSFSIY